METEKKIFDGALKLYLKYGVKSVTMDDVAKYLAISKKTLYQYVSNKVELIEKCLELYFEENTKRIEEIIEASTNPIDELFSIDKNICQEANRRNPSMIFELQKYYPAIYRKIMDMNAEHIYDTFLNNIKVGQEMGLYRDDINPVIISKLYVARVDHLVDTELFPITEFDFKEIVDENFKYHLRGIVSRKGLDYLDQLLS